MIDFHSLIILSYIKEMKKEYEISDIVSILGTDYEAVGQLISNLLEENLLMYNEFLLEITPKGVSMLYANNMEHYQESDTEYEILKIYKENSISIDKPYIPKNFMKK